MEATTILFISWSISVLLGFTAVVMLAVSWRRACKRLRAERVRGAFADARNALVLSALKGELSVKSATYNNLYFLCTAVMRRDDQYDSMWTSLLGAIASVKEQRDDDPIKQEAKFWTPEIRSVVAKTGAAIEVMLIEHSRILSMLAWSSGGLFRDDQRKRIRTDKVEDFEQRFQPERREVREFQELVSPSFGAAAA